VEEEAGEDGVDVTDGARTDEVVTDGTGISSADEGSDGVGSDGAGAVDGFLVVDLTLGLNLLICAKVITSFMKLFLI
jgi:hypothetical protein